MYMYTVIGITCVITRSSDRYLVMLFNCPIYADLFRVHRKIDFWFFIGTKNPSRVFCAYVIFMINTIDGLYWFYLGYALHIRCDGYPITL